MFRRNLLGIFKFILDDDISSSTLIQTNFEELIKTYNITSSFGSRKINLLNINIIQGSDFITTDIVNNQLNVIISQNNSTESRIGEIMITQKQSGKYIIINVEQAGITVIDWEITSETAALSPNNFNAGTTANTTLSMSYQYRLKYSNNTYTNYTQDNKTKSISVNTQNTSTSAITKTVSGQTMSITYNSITKSISVPNVNYTVQGRAKYTYTFTNNTSITTVRINNTIINTTATLTEGNTYTITIVSNNSDYYFTSASDISYSSTDSNISRSLSGQTITITINSAKANVSISGQPNGYSCSADCGCEYYCGNDCGCEYYCGNDCGCDGNDCGCDGYTPTVYYNVTMYIGQHEEVRFNNQSISLLDDKTEAVKSTSSFNGTYFRWRVPNGVYYIMGSFTYVQTDGGTMQVDYSYFDISVSGSDTSFTLNRLYSSGNDGFYPHIIAYPDTYEVTTDPSSFTFTYNNGYNSISYNIITKKNGTEVSHSSSSVSIEKTDSSVEWFRLLPNIEYVGMNSNPTNNGGAGVPEGQSSSLTVTWNSPGGTVTSTIPVIQYPE